MTTAIILIPLAFSIIAIAFCRAASIADARDRKALDAYLDKHGDPRVVSLFRGDNPYHGGDV